MQVPRRRCLNGVEQLCKCLTFMLQPAAPIDDAVESPMGLPAVWPPQFAPGDVAAPVPAPAPAPSGMVSALSQQAPTATGG